MSERGFSLLELLVAATAVSVILFGTGTLFMTFVRFGQENSAQTFLQRQATIIKDEMAKQIQAGSLLSLATGCGGVVDSVQVTNANESNPSAPTGCGAATPPTCNYCFRSDGTTLLEDRPGGGQWDLLTGAPTTLTTTTGACPDSGGFCPTLVLDTTGNAVAVAITFRLRYRYPFTDSLQTMSFTTTITPRNP